MEKGLERLNATVRWTVAADGLTEANLNFHFLWGMKMQTSPVAVPDKIFGLTLSLDFIDRCHSLHSLHPPPAAVVSLPLPAYAAYGGNNPSVTLFACQLPLHKGAFFSAKTFDFQGFSLKSYKNNRT